MKRQLSNGTYRLLGKGRARPRGVAIGTSQAPDGTVVASKNTGARKNIALAGTS